MDKAQWRPGNMLYPVPAVLVSCGGKDGKKNMLTVAWTGTVCSDPAMVYISVRKERYSYEMIRETGEYVINLTTEKLARAADFCGVRSGRDMDKFKETRLTPEMGTLDYAPTIRESPVSIECRVEQILPLGSHDMFLARVESVFVDGKYMDEKGAFHLEKAGPIVYSHGQYFGLGEAMGSFGYSVRRKKKQKR